MHLMKYCRRGMTAAALLLALTACSTPPTPAMYAQEIPKLDLQQYFNGTLDAHGIFQDRSGKVVKRFTVVMRASWAGEVGTLTRISRIRTAANNGACGPCARRRPGASSARRPT